MKNTSSTLKQPDSKRKKQRHAGAYVILPFNFCRFLPPPIPCLFALQLISMPCLCHPTAAPRDRVLPPCARACLYDGISDVTEKGSLLSL